jgi:hypothetical protein
MNNLVTVLTIFVSSPADVAGERLALVRAIERINRLAYIRERFVLRPFRYEETPPLAGQEAQLVVDGACAIQDCYLVVCILWCRMGTPFKHPQTDQFYLSGTEYKFRTAYHAYESYRQPIILLYRKNAQAPTADPGSDQARLVDEFFGKFEGDHREFQGLYVPFSTTDEFEERIFQDILNHLYENPPALQPEVELPNFVEEERRLDVAIPQEAQPLDTIELWVKICTNDSPGLRVELPEESSSPGSPSASDTRNSFMALAFERNDKDGGTSPLQTAVEVASLDFEILAGTRYIELRQGVDSPTLVFLLRVTGQGALGYVQVRVKTKSLNADYWIENGSLSCQVQIHRQPILSRIRSLFSTSSLAAKVQAQTQARDFSLEIVGAERRLQENQENSEIDREERLFHGLMDEVRSALEKPLDEGIFEIYNRMSELLQRLKDAGQRINSTGARDRLSALHAIVLKESCFLRITLFTTVYDSLVEDVKSNWSNQSIQELRYRRETFQILHNAVGSAYQDLESIRDSRHLLESEYFEARKKLLQLLNALESTLEAFNRA